VIVSRGRQYIFVHIPKTGGTSLSLALEGRAKKDDILIGDTPKALQRRKRLRDVQTAGRLWKHSGLRDISGLVTQSEIESLFVFTLVRNPWDRMVSYYHWLRAQSFTHPAVQHAKTLEFSDFLNHPFITQSIAANLYSSYVTDTSGTERCQLFIRLEQLQNDLAPLEQHLGFSLGVIPHENQSDRQSGYRSNYTDKDAEHLASLAATDIARFGYSF